jgi:hypothetical protein
VGLPGYRKEHLRVVISKYSASHLLVLALHRIVRRNVCAPKYLDELEIRGRRVSGYLKAIV